MNRRAVSVLGGSMTAMALLAATVQSTAEALPSVHEVADKTRTVVKQDDRPDQLEARRRALIAKAHEMVINGEAEVKNRGGSKAVRVARGQWVQYETEETDQLLSFLVEFGDAKDQRFPDDPVGPLHNQIPKPDPDRDNSTYWRANFTPRHYENMFFNGMPRQNGESFKKLYEEMSSGRYTVEGDVSEWVKVPNHEASYGRTEDHTDMTRFIDDAAEAWYQAQVDKGMSQDQIVTYLQRYDEWDRFDYDTDGDFSEADGYIDHFQAIHAGEGEEAGAVPEWAIWSHRWAVNQDGHHADGIGPAEYGQNGGIEIGNTGLWIRDYTTEPENGGLGVFAHEYAHDLGLPDLYDTATGENSTAFWSLMSSGSWLGHGRGASGTTPNHMGPWEKLQLGWLDYATAYPSTASTYKLGPSYHATNQAQALVMVLPKHKSSQYVGEAAEGDNFFYSGRGDERTATMTSPEFTVPATQPRLTAQVKYEIELDWDYAYAEISTDGGETFTPLETNLSTDTNPNGQNDGNGITGTSEGEWVELTADLSEYAGDVAHIRFRMFNDAVYNEMGLMVDDITVDDATPGDPALREDAEDGAPDWTLDDFYLAEGGEVVTGPFAHYYIAENRQYLGYDKTLKQGPYNFTSELTKPNWLEHFPYQNGLLVWYWNTEFTDNDVSVHPGGGEVLPVDARPGTLRWSNGDVVRNRIQAFDATFGLERTDAISLHRQVATDDGRERVRLNVRSRPGVPVFNDSDPNRYYRPKTNPTGSVQVAGTGTKIRLVRMLRGNVMEVRVRGSLH